MNPGIGRATIAAWLCVHGLLFTAPLPCRADSSERDSTAQAMVLLRKHCAGCHNEKKGKGGLVLTTREQVLAGGQSGAVLSPGDASASKLIAVLQPGGDPHMPPEEQLSDEEIATVAEWIGAGAVWDSAAFASATERLDREALQKLPAEYRPVLSLSLSPDGKHLAAGAGDQIALFERQTNRFAFTRFLGTQRDAIQALAWSADGKMLASGGYRRVVIMNLESGLERELTSFNGRITALAFTPDSKTLVAADTEVAQRGRIWVGAIEEWQEKASWAAHDDAIYDLDISPDGKMAASAGADRVVRLWDLQSGELIRTLEGHVDQVYACAFSADGKRLVSGGGDREVKFWNPETGEQTGDVRRHPMPVMAVTWIAEGKVLVAGEDGVLRICTESQDRPQRAFNGAADMLYAVVASPDFKMYLGGCHDGQVYQWNDQGKIEYRYDAGSGAAP